jgi:hypothetical protein
VGAGRGFVRVVSFARCFVDGNDPIRICVVLTILSSREEAPLVSPLFRSPTRSIQLDDLLSMRLIPSLLKKMTM